MRSKETLQLRHQLSASGLSLRTAAYDTRRHHVLTFDSHPLRPHVLRLFSLRRELQSAPLFDKDEHPSRNVSATQGRNRPSLFELQQEKLRKHPQVEVVVPTMLLQYSSTLDVFVCVYSRANRPKGSSKVPKTTTHCVVLLEPATLRQLLVYSAPGTHSLQCVHYDPLTDRLALASHLQEREEDAAMLPSAPKNVVEVLQLSKRLDDRQSSWTTSLTPQQPKMLLFIENTRLSLRHPDTLKLICGSRGMRELYGAAMDCPNSVDTTNALLEWRQNEPKGRFVLVRRVMVRQAITAMAVSPCGDWLFAGCCKGGLKVWNVNGSRTNGSALFLIDGDPYEPTGESIAEAQTEVISTIEIATTPTLDSSGDLTATPGSAEVIVIVAGRDTGGVRHWKFSVERKKNDHDKHAAISEEHRYPRLSLVGYFHAGGKDQVGQERSPNMLKSQDTLGPPLKTVIMCVTIDMGSCFENLLLVVHEDVIHVLKVQTVLYIIQEFASIEEAFAIRAIEQQGECKVLSLSSTAACKLRIFPLDEAQLASSTKLLFIPPHALATSAHVSSMETLTSDMLQLCFVVIAWSNGIVDVYDVLHERHVLKLHDSQLTDQVSALSVINYQCAMKSKDKLSLDAEAGFLSYRSFEDVSQTRSTDPATDRSSTDSDEAASRTRKTFIVVGTESGKLFGWNADVLWSENLSFQSVQKANVRGRAAHSSHIVQLSCIDADVRGERASMGSVGADGIVKFWRIPSLKMVGYVNSVAEGYPVTPSCLELMNSYKKVAGAPIYGSVGFEDGRLAVWLVDFKRVLFQRLQVSARHERRVSKICRISSDFASAGLTEFLSCSLDMTVIHWQITETGIVQEKRYFDIGAAIVDMLLVKEQAVVALAHEVCKFAFAPSSKSDMKYLVKPGTIADTHAKANDLSSEQPNSTTVENQPQDDDEYPNTPTTSSVEDLVVGALPSLTPRSVDEYLTLHVPSAVLRLEASSSNIIGADTGTGASEQDEGMFRLQNERSIKLPGHGRESSSTGRLRRHLVNDETLREYLQDYIVRHGTGGTMAANRITHLLALRPELPSVRRPGFALAKSLKDLKLTDQTRVDSEEALQILKTLFAVCMASNQSFDAPTMTRSLRQEGKANERARAQRVREKKQSGRKPVVTYNLLGEKYVRWEEIHDKQEDCKQNQSPPSPTNSLVVHTPPSPNIRDAVNDSPSRSGGAGFHDSKTPKLSSSIPSGSPKPSSVEGITTSHPSKPRTIPSDDFMALDRKIDSVADENPSAETSQQNSSEDEEEEDGDGDYSDDEGNHNESEGGDEGASQDDGETTDAAQSNTVQAETEVPQASASASEALNTKRTRKMSVISNKISEDALVNGIHLSPIFRQFWTKGYCWCRPAPRLHIVRSRQNEAKTEDKKTRDHKTDSAIQHKEKCKGCHKLMHTVELPRVGYTPHFSRQATFDIIVEVYSKLTATAHSRLYKTDSLTNKSPSECSIFSALFELFLATYGMRTAVELKLKLFFVSMCHYLREYDAIAVFGELLGLHTPDDTDEHEHAPNTLVALCVCCYSWLYSRGMVVNGDPFSGRVRGFQWGSSYRQTSTEVVPAIDGTTHWQFVRIEHALLCAQDNLLYPLVSPGLLRNIMLFMHEYAQRLPSRSLRTDSPDYHDSANQNGNAIWIELHRFLRLLVGEWKQQNAEFRAVERLLFVYPQHDAVIDGGLLEKLRLMLSCFVFYDHERVGAMAISDFETLLYKLRYLWFDESVKVTLNDTEFDKATWAIKKRFIDLNHDGQLCYLDFWAMLYIVGVKTRGLIHFHELPSFCRDYRLEVSPELSGMMWNYMQLSCTLLLPKGLQVGRSSIDQKAERQHRRRAGGLHDGTFHFAKSLKGSLSTQELLANDDAERLGLFLDGTMPVTRQTASTTALDRFRPVSVEVEFDSTGSSCYRSREPVVVGVRPTGPTPKPVAPLRVSFMGNFDLLSGSDKVDESCASRHQTDSRRYHETLSEDMSTAYTSMYIQFPQVPPVRRRVGGALPSEMVSYSARKIAGSIVVDDDRDEETIVDEAALNQEDHEEGQVEIPLTMTPITTRILSARSVRDIPPPVEESPEVVDRPESPKPVLEKRRSATAVVVVPTIETAALLSRTNSRIDLLGRSPPREFQRAVSERIKLEETVVQLEVENVFSRTRQSLPTMRVETERAKAPLGSESDDSRSEDDGSKPSNEAIEQPDEEFQLVDPDECVAVPVEENILPEPEPIVEVRVEPTVELILVQSSIVEEVIETVVVDEPKAEPENVPDAVVDIEVATETKVVIKEVNSTSTEEEPLLQIEEPPAIVLETDIEDDAPEEEEEVFNTVVQSQHTPQVIKEGDIQIHRAFRFSQQPTFLHSAAVTNNPYRTAMWNPKDDSDSDDGDSSEKKKIIPSSTSAVKLDESVYSNGEECLTGIASLKLGKSPQSEDVVNASAPSQLSSSALSPSSTVPKSAATVTQQPFHNPLSRLDSKLQPTQRVKRDKQINSLDYQFSDGLEAVQDEAEEDLGGVLNAPLGLARRTHLDDDAERALYGERVMNVLGEGIAFSAEAEVVMKQKWQQFFDDSESRMFATMRQDLEKKQTEQREAEERQRKLRKKWQEQRDQDLQRLQNSRQNSVLMSTSNTATTNGGVDASFRLRRIHRESCRQLTEELQFGMSVQRELTTVKVAEFFHFYYLPESHGSIITLTMHVTRGDAEVFMSTDTKVPCATDFMWRSSERLAKDSGEGHRIVLCPHDLLRVVTAATTNAAQTEYAAAVVESNASTASLRSFYPKEPDSASLRVGFYLSVVALEPGTTFKLAVMSSGQKMQSSRAIQTVDYLIGRFNMLSRSFQGQSFSSTSEVIPSREMMKQTRQSSSGNENDMTDENDDGSDEKDTASVSEAGRRKSKKVSAERVDSQELKSFQRLLETLSEKRGYGSPRANSILLAGPSEEHLEFVQDEDQRLKEIHQRLSPPKHSSVGVRDIDAAISVVTERRLTLQGKRQKLRRVVAARLQQKLAPLCHKSIAGGQLEKSASTGALVNMRLAKTALRPVAYSITSLDLLPRSQRFKASVAPLLIARSNDITAESENAHKD